MSLEKLSTVFDVEHDIIKDDTKEIVIRKGTDIGKTTDTTDLVEVEATEVISPDAVDDFKAVRSTYRKLLKEGEAALEGIAIVAEEGQEPRAYEVFGNLLKTLADINTQLFDIHSKKKKLAEGVQPPPVTQTHTTQNIDKAVFVGTTAEFMERMKNKKNELQS